MAFTYEFIDHGDSLEIKYNNQSYTAGKKLIELSIPNLTNDNVLKIRSNSATPTDFEVKIGIDTILGVGAGITTATELKDALRAIFFLDDAVEIGKRLIGWQDFADSATSESSPLVQSNVSGGDVHLTNNNNDTLTDGNTSVNAETTVKGLNDLWSTVSNTFVFDDTGIEKNDLISIRVHLNISSSIIAQDFALRFDFYDEPDAGGNFIFSLNQHLATEALSAGVFRERIITVDAFVGESILNGSSKCYLVGTKSFEVEVIGWNIRIFKIAR